jgi:BMFP domain-containing protein YqiC
MSKNISRKLDDLAISHEALAEITRDMIVDLYGKITALESRLAKLESKLDDKIENLEPKSGGRVVMARPLED